MVRSGSPLPPPPLPPPLPPSSGGGVAPPAQATTVRASSSTPNMVFPLFLTTFNVFIPDLLRMDTTPVLRCTLVCGRRSSRQFQPVSEPGGCRRWPPLQVTTPGDDPQSEAAHMSPPGGAGDACQRLHQLDERP